MDRGAGWKTDRLTGWLTGWWMCRCEVVVWFTASLEGGEGNLYMVVMVGLRRRECIAAHTRIGCDQRFCLQYHSVYFVLGLNDTPPYYEMFGLEHIPPSHLI